MIREAARYRHGALKELFLKATASEADIRNDESDSFVLNAEAELVHAPLFYVARALHFIDVHANFVFDISRRLAAVRRKVFKDNSGPVRIILQKLQCFAHQVAFSGDRHKLIQV